MEIISEHDVLQLANSISMKCDLNTRICSISQCSSDFLLSLYHAIMGELPAGVFTKSQSLKSRLHNVQCVISEISTEYLHTDLSHISPESFISGDPVTVYNLLEILDGLLDFMLEQIVDDSGDEADVDTDHFSSVVTSVVTSPWKEDFNGGTALTCTADVTNPKCASLSLTNTSQCSAHDLHVAHYDEEAASSNALPLVWTESKPFEDLSEYTLHSADMRKSNFELASALLSDNDFGQSVARPMYIESLRNSPGKDGNVILKDLTSSLRNIEERSKRSSMEEDVMLDVPTRESGISVSDDTSISSKYKSFFDLSVEVDDNTRRVMEVKVNENVPSPEALDVSDGIPQPDFHHHCYVYNSNKARNQSTKSRDDWEGMLNNLQQTVEESKRVREKYFACPISESRHDDSVDASMTDEILNSDGDKTRKSVHFVMPAKRNVKEFNEILKQEDDLQSIKNKILTDSYKDHLAFVEEDEAAKMKQLREKAHDTELQLRHTITRQRRKRDQSHSSVKKELAAAAKWKSWQAPVVVRTPRYRGKVKEKIKVDMVIGEHDLLPTLIQEFPGLQLSPTTLNNAWKHQHRQLELLTKNETNHVTRKRISEKQLEEVQQRHELLSEMMRRDHDHNMRVRDAGERAAGKREAARIARDRRQQSARIRRYYRDYQLQMRSRMLKRRTREEKLFKNLFEEGLKIQRSRLNDLRKYARDKRKEQRERQRNEIASLENYYKDQFAVLTESLETEKNELEVREAAQNKLLRQMMSGLRKKMEGEVEILQEQICRDDDEAYFREAEADRIRRQLQMASYNAKFHANLEI